MTTPRAVKLYDMHDIALSLAVDSTRTGTRPASWWTSARAARRTSRARTSTGKFVLSLAPSGLGQRLSARGPARRDRRARHQRDRRRRPRRRLSRSDRVDHGQRASRARRRGRCRRRRRARARDAAQPRPEGHHPHRSPRACRCRPRSEIVHAEIPGDGSTTQEVAIGGHLYRGRHQAGGQRRQLRLRADARRSAAPT